MRLEKWFPTVFYYGLYPHINIDILTKFCYDVKSKDQGRKWTNISNSYQSNDLNLETPELKSLIETANKNFLVLHKELGYKDDLLPIIDNMWININPPGGMSKLHKHVDNILSGVFYLQCPENCGNIVFPNPVSNAAYHFHHKNLKEFNENNSSFYHQVAQRSKMIVFPSYAEHYVEPNLSNKDRVSISFNTKLIHRSNND